MGTTTESRLAALGDELPVAAKSASHFFEQAVAAGNILFMSGQIPRRGDEILFKGKLGATLGNDEGYAAARLCALNLVAQLREACQGDISRVKRFIKLTVFVNAAPDFTDASTVANGASDVLVEIFADAGKHARSAIGVATLPRGVGVEVEAIVELKP